MTKDRLRAFPLTPMQVGMLYEGAGSERQWINIEQAVVYFDEEEITDSVLQAAWENLAKRHDVLRLRMEWRGAAAPVQYITEEATTPVQIMDYSDPAVSDRQKTLGAFLRHDRAQGIDLEKDPAWRVALIRFGPRASVMVVTMHHAIVDGRSIGRILREFLTFKDTGSLPRAKKSELDFTGFCAELAKSRNAAEAAEYYQSYLSDFEDTGALDLPKFGELAPDVIHQELLQGVLSETLTARLENVAEVSGGTMANLIQAAWGIVLARWQGRNEVAIGTVRTGRHAVAGTKWTVGCLINTLPLRVELSQDITLGEVILKLRKDTLGMQPFEQTALSDLRAWGELNGAQPLFSSVVMFEQTGMEELVLGQGHQDPLRRIELYEEGGQPLSLAVYGEAALKIVLEYDPSQVSPDLATRLIGHLERLLGEIAQATPATKVGELDMLSAHERQKLLHLACADQPSKDVGSCLVQKFADAAQKFSDRVAVEVVGRTESLTFKELDQRANGLALVLQEHGIKPGDIVAVALERSPAFIVSILAVLKTGAAFLPVDPSYPAATRDHMLADSGAKTIIARSSLDLDHDLDRVDPGVDPTEQAPDMPAEDPDQRAYVIYTSGSTGKPKGVQVSRKNLLSHIAAISAEFELSSKDRVLQFSSLSFDVSLEEIFPTLMNGAALVLRNDAMAQSTATFLEHVRNLRISVVNIPTAFWSILTQYLKAGGHSVPEKVRLMVVGGEQVKDHVLKDWLTLAPDLRWLNGYGPTETTITCTLFDAKDFDPDNKVPIGRPTTHARTYVQATDGSLAPNGAIGELVIAGDAVTLGYIGHPEQNALAFGPNPFEGAGRFYRTGDLAQWNKAGTLVFLGRQDRQVKLRGFRIGLHQIEHTVEEVVGGFQVLVGILDNDTTAARLVAWLAGKAEPDLKALRPKVAAVLPAHMRPTLVYVPEFPRTVGGKVDIAALPRPEEALEEVSDNGGSKFEREVSEIMSQVLKRPTVGLDQNFFDLGGHSLLLVELIGRLETMTGARIGIVDAQSNPTSRQLAKVLHTGSTQPKHIIPIQPEGSHPPLLAVHILGGRDDYFRRLANHLGPDQPVMGVAMDAWDENTPTGVEYTARRYCKDINTYFPDGPINLIAVSLGSYMAFELAQQLKKSGRDVGVLALLDAGGPDGRDEVSGWRRMVAHLKRARYMGPSFPAQFVRNRIHNLRNYIATKQINRTTDKGVNHAPKSAFEFIASNEIAVKAYKARPLDVPITIFRSESHFLDSAQAISSGLGWSSVAAAGFELIDVPGGHLSMLDEPHVATLAQKLSHVMERQTPEAADP